MCVCVCAKVPLAKRCAPKPGKRGGGGAFGKNLAFLAAFKEARGGLQKRGSPDDVLMAREDGKVRTFPPDMQLN